MHLYFFKCLYISFPKDIPYESALSRIIKISTNYDNFKSRHLQYPQKTSLKEKIESWHNDLSIQRPNEGTFKGHMYFMAGRGNLLSILTLTLYQKPNNNCCFGNISPVFMFSCCHEEHLEIIFFFFGFQESGSH